MPRVAQVHLECRPLAVGGEDGHLQHWTDRHCVARPYARDYGSRVRMLVRIAVHVLRIDEAGISRSGSGQALTLELGEFSLAASSAPTGANLRPPAGRDIVG